MHNVILGSIPATSTKPIKTRSNAQQYAHQTDCLDSFHFLSCMTKPKIEPFLHSTLLTLINNCFIRSFRFGFALETGTFFVSTVTTTPYFLQDMVLVDELYQVVSSAAS